MAVKRVVDVGFWSDDKVECFSPLEKLFILYLMTNGHTTQLGIYQITKKLISFEIGLSIEEINKLINKFEKEYNMIKYSNETKEIAIRNYLKYSILSGGKPVEDLLLKEIKQVKDKELLKYVFLNLEKCENLNTTVKKITTDILNQYHNHNHNHNQKSSYHSYDDSHNESLNDSYSEIISYLNGLAGTSFKNSSKSNKKLIDNLLKDYTVDEVKAVVEKMCYLWNKEPKKGEKDMRVYLRPSTLFRRSNFENYFGMNVSKEKLPEWWEKEKTKKKATQKEVEEMKKLLGEFE